MIFNGGKKKIRAVDFVGLNIIWVSAEDIGDGDLM